MKYSIIVPVYNAGKKLYKSIGSVMKQTFSDWELIAVDDGSTDNSLSILKELSEKESRIIIFHQDNAGPGTARNYAISKSHGEYVAFLDADDYWDDDFLQCVNDVNKDIVFYNVVQEKSDGTVINTMRLSEFNDVSKQDLLCMQMTGKFPWGMVKTVKKTLIEINDTCFLQIKVGEEAVFSFSILNNANTFGFINKTVYHYVQGADGQHKKGDEDPWREVILAMKSYLKKNKIYDVYETTINSLAVRALCISLYRISNSTTTSCALRKMRKKIEEYSKQYDFLNINTSAIDKSSIIILHFIKRRKIFPIYVASILRKIILGY